MKIVVLGLSLSSSWGNGHATTFRALLKAFAARGHEVLFLERDVPWYAPHRDLADPDWCRLALYRDVDELHRWAGEIGQADAVIVGSALVRTLLDAEEAGTPDDLSGLRAVVADLAAGVRQGSGAALPGGHPTGTPTA